MELEGGEFFVKKANIRDNNGSLQKKYYSGGEEGVIKTFYPPKFLEVAEHIPNSQLTEKRYASAIQKHADAGNARLPGVPHTHSKPFQKKKAFCKDLQSLILPLDIEKAWHSSVAYTSEPVSCAVLETIVEAELAALFPKHPGLGWVAKWSSSARVKTETEELRIRIYVFLNTPIGEAERIERFSGLDTDDSVFERNCLDLLAPGLVMDRGVPVYEEMPYREVIYREGKRIPVEEFPRIHRRQGNHGAGKTAGTTDLNLYQKILSEADINFGKVKHCSPEVYEAIETAAKAGRLEGNRYRIHYWLMLECFRERGECYDAMAFILNTPSVLGARRTVKDILAVEASVRNYFQKKWNGSRIEGLFRTDEILILDSLNTDENAEQIRNFFGDKITPDRKGQIIVDNQGIGLGKTSTTIGYMTKLYDDDSISICYRKSILLMQCEELGFSYYLDIPDWAKEKYPDTDCSLWDEQLIKSEFLPFLDKPAITIQSLDYLGDHQTGRLEKEYGLLVIDEAERVLDELYIAPELAGDQKNIMGINTKLEMLMELAHRAHTVVLADADASQEITGWLVDTLSRNGKDKYLIQNKQDWYKHKTFSRFDSKEHWLVGLRKMLASGERVLIHTDLGDDTEELTSLVNTIRDFCNLEEHQIVGLHADNVGEPDIRRYMQNAIYEHWECGARCLVISPIIQIGANYTGEPHDRVMLYFHHGRAFGIDRFQTAFRDRKCAWVGYCFAGSFRRTPHEVVGTAFEETPEYQPLFTTTAQEELQARLTQRKLNMRENPNAAFELLIDERGAPRGEPYCKITSRERMQAQEAFKAHSADGRERAAQKHKENVELYQEFYSIEYDANGWSEPVRFDDFDDVSEREITTAYKYLKRGDSKTAKALIDLWLMDDEVVKETAKGDRLAYMILQGELIRHVNNIFNPYLPEGMTLFRAMQKKGSSFDFHITGTQEATAFIDFTRINRDQLDIAALLELYGWKESPHIILQRVFHLLGYDTQILEKAGGKEGSSKLACVWRDTLYKQYLKDRRIQSEQNKKKRKWTLLSEIRKKKLQGFELSELEENFYRSIGKTLIATPRRLTPIRTWLEAANSCGNPHARKWNERLSEGTALPE